MIARRILAPAIALALTALPSAAAVNPQGIAASTCPRCSASDGTATGSCSQVNASFEWSINLGLARYPKPATYAGIGATAYERDGSLPTFGELIGRYFPSTPLQQIQIPLRISQTRISLATFHPSCLILDSEALFERIPQSDAGGAFLHQIVTDDAITQIDLLSGGRPAGYPEGTNCGPGWQIRVWKRPTSLGDKDEDDYYVTTSLGTPLTNAVICRPQGKTTNDNDTLLFILMETTGAQSEDSRTTTQIIAQTLGTSTQSYSYDRPVGVVSSLYAGVVTTDPGSTGGAPLSRETLVYGDHGAKKWDYTITRTVQVQPSPLPAPYGSTTLITTAESEEDYDDYSPASGGGEPGMKRLMSFESSGRTTEYEYFSEPTVPSTHGRPKSVTRPDGSWTAWEYIVDTVSIFTEYSSWPDVAIEDKATARKTVTTVSGSGFTVESYVAGQPVAKSWTVISGQTVTDSQWDATASEWHDTVTVYFPDGCSDPPLAAGRVSSVTRPDGTRTTYTYGGSATNQIVTEVADSASSPAGSAGPDALKTITHYNSGNIAIQQDVYIVAAGSADRPILTESWQAYAPAGFDALGRPVRRDFADSKIKHRATAPKPNTSATPSSVFTRSRSIRRAPPRWPRPRRSPHPPRGPPSSLRASPPPAS
jgi:hypothetical protein